MDSKTAKASMRKGPLDKVIPLVNVGVETQSWFYRLIVSMLVINVNLFAAFPQINFGDGRNPNWGISSIRTIGPGSTARSG